jgi:hypothetical protein
MCSLTRVTALVNSSVLRESPLLKNINETAKYLTVYSGFNKPPFAPIKGFAFAPKMAKTIPIKNQCFFTLEKISIFEPPPIKYKASKYQGALRQLHPGGIDQFCVGNFVLFKPEIRLHLRK